MNLLGIILLVIGVVLAITTHVTIGVLCIVIGAVFVIYPHLESRA